MKRSAALLLLVAAVLLAHLWLADAALPDTLDAGAAETRPARIEVAFVQELAPRAAPAVAPAPRAAARSARIAAKPAPAASAASVASAAEGETDVVATAEPAASAASAPEAPPEVAVAVAQAMPAVTEVALPASAVAAAASAAAVTTPASAASGDTPAAGNFEWPPSTRLSYRLSGNYRGPVEGQAQVQWLRSGAHYQVTMDLSIGPSFAPLMSRRVSSDGEITAQGLRPLRYDEETKVVLRDPRRLKLTMDGDQVVLADGRQAPRPQGLQDSASQFVQLTWLFTMNPELLQPGRSIVLPLALPRVVENWTYDIVGSEILDTPAGPVATVHVKPRREPRPGGDLTAETWVAPSLQYLPVRILIRQDAETYIDLSISRLPEQAAPGK